MILDEITQRDFLISEYHETHQYLRNIENSMLDLLKLYNSVLAILVPISALIVKFFEKKGFCLLLSVMVFIFFLLGLYILGMYIELRVRKIKTLEQIAVYRERFIEINPKIFSKYLKMITSIKSCPPYLRRPSSEWYTVIYISVLGSLSLAFALTFFLLWINTVFCFNWLDGLSLPFLICLPLSILIFSMRGLFLWSTRYCYIYDLKREKQYHVKNEYFFLDPEPYFPTIFQPLNRLAEKHERKIKSRHGSENVDIDERKKFESNCEFCMILQEQKEVIIDSQYFFCKWDFYPVSKGHMLIIPKRHVTSCFDLRPEEFSSLQLLIMKAKKLIEAKYAPTSYNIGVNIGKDAGQTIEHLHIHLIPRYPGDVEDPEGGIRNVIPGKGKYRK